MALTTYNKRQEELAKNQQPVTSNKGYQGMSGVSENTRNNLGNYQQGYKPSESVTRYQQQLQQAEAAKPQGYNSKYAPQLESILQQITNPQDFKYEFNGDNLFKYYADLYTQKGKQASMDSMGQAAALTGGYGNSYAQQVGQQAYQQNLMNLYDRGMDLRNAAYQQYQDKLAGQKDAYNYLSAADQTDYGRYQDEYANWQNERAYAAQMADAERNFDYSQYQQDLNYWTNMAQAENQAAQTERAFNENVRQFDANMEEEQRQFNETSKLNYDQLAEKQREFDANLTEEQRQYNQSLAVDYVSAILANGQMPTNDLLIMAGLSYEDAQKLMAQLQTGGGSGGSGNKKIKKAIETGVTIGINGVAGLGGGATWKAPEGNVWEGYEEYKNKEGFIPRTMKTATKFIKKVQNSKERKEEE